MSETVSDVLLSHRLCQIDVHAGRRLVATTQRRPWSEGGAWILGAFGLFSVVGLPFVALAYVYLTKMKNNWGQVVIDTTTDTISWRQGDTERGSWPLSQLRKIELKHAWNHSYRRLIGIESWVYATLEGGLRLPLMMGYPEERKALLAQLEEWQLPRSTAG